MRIFYSLSFSIIICVFSLYFNFSFTFFGVDLNKIFTEKNFINNYIQFSIKPILKTLFIYFIFIYFLFELLFFYRKSKYNYFIYGFFYILLIFFVSLFHSIVRFPQIYGDFFYNQYPNLISILHFLTDYTKPVYWSVVLIFLLCIPILLNLYFLIYHKAFDSVYFSFIVLFLVFHWIGSLYFFILFIVLFLLFRLFQNYFFKNKKKNLIFSTFLLLISCIFYVFSFLEYFPKNIYLSFQKEHSKINVVLISCDSLREDKITQKLTPNLYKFLQERNVYRFKDHHTTISRTFPSWTDLLTSHYGSKHKIRHMFPSREDKKTINLKKIQTLPDLLNKNGYYTAVIASFAGDIFSRIEFGYQEVNTPNFNVPTIITQKILQTQFLLLPLLTGSFLGGGAYIKEIRSFVELGSDVYILRDTLDFLKKNKFNPYFLTFFSSVAHFPYSSSYPYYKKFTDPNYYGNYKYYKFVDIEKDEKLSLEDKQQIRNLYNNSVYSFDVSLGKILEQLRKSNFYNNTFIIITSDHGETFSEENSSQGHGNHLKGEGTTKIPLILKLPKSFIENKKFLQKKQFDVTTTNLDIFPTILEILNIPLDEKLEGKSLISALEGNWEEDRTVYSETGIWFWENGNTFFQKNRISYPSILKMQNIIDKEIQIDNQKYNEMINLAKHRTLLNYRYKLIYMPTKDQALYYCYDRKQDPLNEKPINLKFCASLMEKFNEFMTQKEKMINLDGYFLPKSML